jgi:membrane protease subunit (stomatin/prohibitin family)
VYYFNLNEITGNKYGTPNPVPFRVVDQSIGQHADIFIRCHGQYAYRLTDPLLFYTNVSGNVADVYRRSDIDTQLKAELLAALGPAFARVSALGIPYSALPGHTAEIAAALNEVLAEQWARLRGISVSALNIKSITRPPEEETLRQDLPRNTDMRSANTADAALVTAQADTMQATLENEAVTDFSGAGWTCACSSVNTGRFCAECGAPQPPPADTWTCTCSAVNTGRFCPECGAARPTADSWTCQCGADNTGRFCAECGTPR